MLLAVDTSTRIVGVALYNGTHVLSEICWVSKSHHTVELGPAVADTLRRVDVKSTAMDAVGVAIGPGSFTGLRIGLAFAKGLAFGNHVPLLGIPTLDVLAYAQPITAMVLAAVLEIGRERIAVGWYQPAGGNWHSNGMPENLAIDDFIERIEKPTLVCGEIAENLRARLAEKSAEVSIASPAQSLRRPAYLAELAWKRWKAGEADDPVTLNPIYLHHGEPIPG